MQLLLPIKETIANINAKAKMFSFVVPGLGQMLDNGAMGQQMALDFVITGRRQVEQNGVGVKSAYTTLAMPLANLTGVTGASYYVDGTDPISGTQLSTIERSVQGIFGSIQLVGTAFGVKVLGSSALRPSMSSPANKGLLDYGNGVIDVGVGMKVVPQTTVNVGATYNPALMQRSLVVPSFAGVSGRATATPMHDVNTPWYKYLNPEYEGKITYLDKNNPNILNTIRHETQHLNDFINHPQIVHLAGESKLWFGKGFARYWLEVRAYKAGSDANPWMSAFRSFTTEKQKAQFVSDAIVFAGGGIGGIIRIGYSIYDTFWKEK